MSNFDGDFLSTALREAEPLQSELGEAERLSSPTGSGTVPTAASNWLRNSNGNQEDSANLVLVSCRCSLTLFKDQVFPL